MRRRTLLTAVGLSATASTAGCLDAVLDRGGGQIHLARLAVENHAPTSNQFDLRVDRDGETVHRSSHRVRGRGEDRIYSAVADCDWGTVPGAYEVFGRADGGSWTSKPLADVRDGGRDSAACATALAEYHEDGTLWIRLRADCEQFAPSASAGVCPDDRETSE